MYFKTLSSFKTLKDKNENLITFSVKKVGTIPLDLAEIEITNSDNFKVVTFKLPLTIGSVKLSDLELKIHYILDNENYCEDLTNIIINNDNFSCQWIVEREKVESKNIYFIIEASTTNFSNLVIYRYTTEINNLEIKADYSLSSIRMASLANNITTLSELNSEIKDDQLPYLIENRAIQIDSSQRIVVEKDTNSQVISFTMNRFFDNIDLSTKTINIKFLNEENLGDRSLAVNLETTEDTITFGWLIDYKATSISGIVRFAVEFLELNEDNEVTYRWQTIPAELVVEEGLNVDSYIPEQEPTYLQEYLEKFNQLFLDTTTAKEEAYSMAEEATRQADIATGKAVEVENSLDIFTSTTLPNAIEEVTAAGTKAVEDAIAQGDI